MLADGPVDELHLFVFPLTRGSGPRLFSEEDAPRKLSRSAWARVPARSDTRRFR